MDPSSAPSPQRLLWQAFALFAAYALFRQAMVDHYSVVVTADELRYEWILASANGLLALILLGLGLRGLGWRPLWNSPGRPWMTLILGAGVVLSCGYSWSGQVMAPMTPTFNGLRLAALGLGLGMALAEEIGFHGLAYGAVERLKGETWAIGVSAILFTLLHVDQRLCAASPRTALGGLALSLGRARGLSLGDLILIHFAAEAAWALFLPLDPNLDATRELTSAAVNGLVCVAMWRMKKPAL